MRKFRLQSISRFYLRKGETKLTIGRIKSLLISSSASILIVMLAVGSFSYFYKFSSKPILTISVELYLYCFDNRSRGYIRDFTLATSGRFIESTDNVTMTWNSTKPISDVSYTIFFTLNESSFPSLNWNYTIMNKPQFQGHFEGYVISSVKVKGSYRLTIELRGYHLESEEKLGAKSTYIKVF